MYLFPVKQIFSNTNIFRIADIHLSPNIVSVIPTHVHMIRTTIIIIIDANIMTNDGIWRAHYWQNKISTSTYVHRCSVAQ